MGSRRPCAFCPYAAAGGCSRECVIAAQMPPLEQRTSMRTLFEVRARPWFIASAIIFGAAFGAAVAWLVVR